MAELVGCFAASHTPLFVLRADRPAPAVRQRVFGQFERMGRTLVERGAEALVVFGNDHLQAFFLDRLPALAVGVAARFRAGRSESWLPEVEGGRPGDPALAKYLLRALLADGFDPAMCHELPVDHSVVVPLYRMGDPPVPIVPVLQNTVAPPLAPAQRSFDLGRAVRRALDAYPGVQRVALLATGGPSHWIGTPEMGRIDEAWDRKVLDLLAQGRADVLAKWTQLEIDAGGNGAHEIRNWLAAAAAAGNTKAACWVYQPEPLWYIAATILEWPIGPPC
jgi:hypothetical protein